MHRRALYDYYMSNSRHYAVATAAASYSIIQHYTLQVWGLYAVSLLHSSCQSARERLVPRRAPRPRLSIGGLFFSPLLLAAAPCCRPPVFRLWVFEFVGSMGFWVYGHLDFGPLAVVRSGAAQTQTRTANMVFGRGESGCETGAAEHRPLVIGSWFCCRLSSACGCGPFG